MVISTLMAAAVLIAPAAQGSQAGQLVSKMLAKTSTAHSMSGEIVMNLAALNDGGQIRTRFQYQAPSRVYIRQEKLFGDRAVSLVTSDGETFTYNAPNLPLQDRGVRLIEKVNQRGRNLSYREIYAAAVLGLLDRSAPLDIAIGRPEDLRFWTNQLATLEYRGLRAFQGQQAHVIGGAWREYGDAPNSGRYELVLSQNHDLLQYTLEIPTGVTDPATRRVVQRFNVVTRWEVRFDLDPKIDPALFKVIR